VAHVNIPEADALLDKEFKVLDHGFVRLIDYMGGDQAIVQAARVSYGEGTKKVTEDRGLIRYLLRHKHTTPFEMVEFKFHVKLPIFVARQWIRHRSANVNEYSGRYSVMKEEFYVPDPEVIRFQSTVNKQGRSTEEVPDEVKTKLIDYLKRSNDEAYSVYNAFVEDGLARELARINLPLSMYTEWYWKIDLHNLFHFLRLRMDPHAQYEIQKYAEVMAEMVKAVCPVAWEAFIDYHVDSEYFSKPELQVLKDSLADFDLSVDDLEARGLSRREARELRAKIRRVKKL
jgi:thymidylate synthase (FAD)